MFIYIGLLIVVIAWAYQLIKYSQGSRKLHKTFVGLYAVGIAFLTYDSYLGGDMYVTLLNLLTLVGSGAIFFLGMKR